MNMTGGMWRSSLPRVETEHNTVFYQPWYISFNITFVSRKIKYLNIEKIDSIWWSCTSAKINWFRCRGLKDCKTVLQLIMLIHRAYQNRQFFPCLGWLLFWRPIFFTYLDTLWDKKNGIPAVSRVAKLKLILRLLEKLAPRLMPLGNFQLISSD